MKKPSGAKYLAVIATVVIVLSVVAAILILDPPGMQRKRRLDSKRVRNLMSISYSINSFWERKKSLPPDLATLEKEPGLRTTLRDPERGIPYDYQVTGSNAYRLCATFSLDSSDESQEYNNSRKWSHGAGKQCFDLTPPKRGNINGED